MSKEIIIIDGSYYQKVGTELQQIYVVGFEQKTKNCFSDIEPLKITNKHLMPFPPLHKPKETRRERRKRKRNKKK